MPGATLAPRMGLRKAGEDGLCAQALYFGHDSRTLSCEQVEKKPVSALTISMSLGRQRCHLAPHGGLVGAKQGGDLHRSRR